MNAKKISITLLTLIACNNSQSMETELSKLSVPVGNEDVWLLLIAQCPAKQKMRETCKYFREFASTKNEKIWLQNPLVVNKDLMEQCALYYADMDNTNIVINLLNQGLDATDQDLKANRVPPKTLLYYAAKNNNLLLVTKLLDSPHFILDDNPITVGIEDKIKMAFTVALRHNCHEAAKQIFVACKNNQNLVETLIFSYTGYQVGNVLNHSTDITKHIVTSIQNNPAINSFLEQACEDGAIKSVIALLSFTQYEPKILSAALYRAIEKGHTRIAKILIDHGADVNATAPCRSVTALRMAIFNGHINCARLLINEGATITTHSDDPPLLYYALLSSPSSQCIRKPLVQLLLSKGANPNEKNLSVRHNKSTLLECALSYGNKVMEVLITHPKIDINQTNAQNKTVLDIAIARRDTGSAHYRQVYELVIPLLIKHGAKTSSDLQNKET